MIGLGVILAAYAYYVEYRTAEARRMGLEYKALCDFSIFSCTTVFSSQWGSATQMIGLPKLSNALTGLLFYLFELLIERHTPLLLLCSLASCVGSVVLFYALTFILHDFCVVCFTVYVVNFTTFYVAWKRFRTEHPCAADKKK